MVDEIVNILKSLFFFHFVFLDISRLVSVKHQRHLLQLVVKSLHDKSDNLPEIHRNVWLYALKLPAVVYQLRVESTCEKFHHLINLHHRIFPLHGHKAMFGIEIKQDMKIRIVLLVMVCIVSSDSLCLIGLDKKASYIPRVFFQTIAMLV